MRTSNHPRRRFRPRDIVSLLITVAIVVAARSSLADHYNVPSGSMEPTLQPGDRILVDKLAYGLRLPLTDVMLVPLREPARGDVVVLTSPEGGHVLVKRLVAREGDRVEVRSGRVSLNGQLAPWFHDADGTVELLESGSHRVDLRFGGGPDFGPTVVPLGALLVMGDSRGNSLDGRSFGFVSRGALLGRAVAVFVRHGKPRWIGL